MICEKCNREFESQTAYDIHIDTHKETIIQKIDTLEVLNMFGEKKEEQKPIEIPQFVKTYLCHFELEILDKKDKKAMKVWEEINKTFINLMNDGYDITIKEQKIQSN